MFLKSAGKPVFAVGGQVHNSTGGAAAIDRGNRHDPQHERDKRLACKRQNRLFGALFAGKSPLEGKGAICYNVPVAGRSSERPAADAEIHTNIKEMQGYMKLGIVICVLNFKNL